MESGFSQAWSDNLPRVDGDMIAQYFANNPDYMSAEMKGVKVTRAGREHYGDEAIGFVQVRRDQGRCKVRCRITPEHKIRQKDYHVCMEIDEDQEQIISLTCTDCVAAPGGCKHSTAFIFWLHHRSEEPATTSKECYWKSSKLAKAGRGKSFVKICDLSEKKIGDLPAVTGEFREAVLQEGIAQKATGMIFESYLPCELVKNTSIHQLSLTYIEGLDAPNCDDFIQFCSLQLTREFCVEAEIQTRSQADSSLWNELRYGRITASRAHEASRCTTYDGVLVESIMGATPPLSSSAVKRGKELEGKVLEVVAARMDMNVNKCGLFMDPEFPLIGASPDGINDDCCFEVKCPSKESTIKNYIKNGIITPGPYAQMQLQMHLAKRAKCLFCIASPSFEDNNEVDIIECLYNEDFCKSLIEKCVEFWKKSIFKKLFHNY